jgi:hypothetical protein
MLSGLKIAQCTRTNASVFAKFGLQGGLAGFAKWLAFIPETFT